MIGIGFIAYDSNGIILAKISKCINGNVVRLVEVIAVEEALELAVHCG